MSLEFLRRASKEYDRYIVRQNQQQHQHYESATVSDTNITDSGAKTVQSVATPQQLLRQLPRQFRPNLLQQIIRALFHMVQFTVAYFIMLLAMYYNGYIIISIIIGAFLGAFVFSWETISLG